VLKRLHFAIWAAAAVTAVSVGALLLSGRMNLQSMEMGERPHFLVNAMPAGKLREQLQACAAGPFRRTSFSIAHRGAPLQFPEHTREGYVAAGRMGAGAIECDVTFTSDGTLVCRHDECDLHTTTNIVDTPLNALCSTPWSGPDSRPRCCASDLTLAQFRSLRGKMDASNPAATTPAGYLGGTAAWRTDLYASHGTLMTLQDSIRLNRQLGVAHVPELKSGDAARIQRIFGGQQAYAQKLVDMFRAEGVDPRDVWLQSFDERDIRYWLREEPAFGRQAVYLDDVAPAAVPAVPRISPTQLNALHTAGLRIIAPPIGALLAVDATGSLVPSDYAREIRASGFQIIAWSLERSDLRNGVLPGDFYYSFDTAGRAVRGDGDLYSVLDVLARGVGVRGVFSDWPATTTYYANCMMDGRSIP
jgi:glycerophosphoryl diester phosphodiesterase